jgi:histone H3/H4
LSGAKAAMAEELEDLTQKLFEEANSLVANEARQRFDFQTKVIFK